MRLKDIGRKGQLRCQFVREGTRTVAAVSSCSTPWHFIPPSYLDDSGCACFWLVNPSGGLVGGDHVVFNAKLESDTHVIITSPSANRVYRSVDRRAIQDVRLTVGEGARLEWVPEVTIPFGGARIRQRLHAYLAEGASALVWDAMASGRVARGERWAFTSFDNEIRISLSSGQCLVERFTIEPSGKKFASFVTEWDYAASVFVVGDGLSMEGSSLLEEKLAALLDQNPGRVLGGVSKPAVSGLAMKMLARSAPDLANLMQDVWKLVREHLWNLPPAVMRRY